MAAVSDSRASVPYFIEENSVSLKIASCIPFVGCFISESTKVGLDQKINKLISGDKQSFYFENITNGKRSFLREYFTKSVELLKVREDYQVADLVRGVLSLAVIVFLAVIGFFTGPVSVLFGGGCGMLIVLDVIDLEEKHRMIKDWEALLEQSACQA